MWSDFRRPPAATEIQVVGLVEALELTLLIADRDPAKYERTALRWHVRFVYESKNVGIRREPGRPRSPRRDSGERFCL